MTSATTPNTDGHAGPICGTCGGYGFTNTITGGSMGCAHCQGRGIEPPDIYALARQMARLETLLTQQTIRKTMPRVARHRTRRARA